MTKTQRQKAVAVAQDVLAQIKFLGVRQGAYLRFDNMTTNLLLEHRGESLQKLLPQLLKPSKPCTVCALGGLFLSYVNLFNKVKVETDYSEYLTVGELVENRNGSPLRNVFSAEQLALIECAFEVLPEFAYLGGLDSDDARVLAAVTFGKKYQSAPNRVRAIMRNIIENDGEFIPPPVKV